jgi:hypothetical protein
VLVYNHADLSEQTSELNAYFIIIVCHNFTQLIDLVSEKLLFYLN